MPHDANVIATDAVIECAGIVHFVAAIRPDSETSCRRIDTIVIIIVPWVCQNVAGKIRTILPILLRELVEVSRKSIMLEFVLRNRSGNGSRIRFGFVVPSVV